MKTELIKQMVNLAEGFKYGYKFIKVSIGNHTISYDKERIETWEHFPTLVNRTVQGFNRKNEDTKIIVDYSGDYDTTYVTVIKPEYYREIFYKDYEPTGILTVEEVCLLKALEEVLE